MSREEAIALPTQAPTREPTPVNTRVLPVDVLTPQPTPTITPIPDEVMGLVVDVIDGATIAVVLDGDPARLAYQVRYLGIEVPDNTTGEPWGVVAFEFNQELTRLKIVRLVRDETDFDDDGFLLRHVYVDNQLLSVILAERGLARAAVEEPNTRFDSEISEAEERAREQQIGLWSRQAPTPTRSLSEEPTSEEGDLTATAVAMTPTVTATTTVTGTPTTAEPGPTEVPTVNITATTTATGTVVVTPGATAENSSSSDLRGP